MKVYIVSGYRQNSGDGYVEAFSNKEKAKARQAELKRDAANHVFDITVEKFEINAKGLLAAIQCGAQSMWK